ncbi:MAG: DUF2721 domain-containing protein [Terriglobales bacterium]
MQQETGVTAIAHVIQLSVAPVFLLLAIGTMLAVMTNRLARIVDRARALRRETAAAGGPAGPAAVRESATLTRRGKLISRAIALCTMTALLICAIVAVLFAGAILALDTSRIVAVLFVAAMAAVFFGLLSFLREIFVATAALRLGLDGARSEAGSPPAGAVSG